MANKMLIDATHPEETRVVVLRGNRVEEFDFESANRRQIRGNIYLAKVTRVEPSLQAAFVDYGGNRHGFLAFSEIHPDYYQIPVADRQALIAEDERAHRAAEAEHENRSSGGGGRSGGGGGGRSRRRGRNADRNSESVRSAPVEGQISETPSDDALPDDMVLAEAQADEAAAEKAAFNHASEALTPTEQAENDAHHDDDAHDDHAHDDHAHEPHGDDLNAQPASEAHAETSEAGAHDAEDTHHEDAAHDDSNSDSNVAEHEEEEIVESVGGADALEEVAERAPRHRRQYKIQEVIKRRQIMLVQVVKEERGNKGAALTTYLSLAGRYSVLMPNTARGGGISRKITNSQDRARLKEAASELEVPEGMGVILRTAGASRTPTEIKRDFEYLLRVWETVRDLTLKSTAPTLVYEEGSLVKRSIRDLYSKEIDEIIVAGDPAYQEAKDFMRMLMPSHARNVRHYHDGQPMFTRYGIESQLDAMFSPTMQLRSGGYIVLNQTEALVAIDVNSGRATREHHIEDTALKTNLEAADEIARQLRLRDLAGLVVIDFIDMDENRNNRAVERRLKDALKNDRARIQVGRISHFGLMEMSRQRIRTSVLESSTDKCPHCGGTGHVRSVSSLALQLLRGIEETLLRGATHNLTVRTGNDVALYILNNKRAHLRDLEERFKISIMVSADPEMGAHQPFLIEKGEQVHTPDQARALLNQMANAEPLMAIEEEDAAYPEDVVEERIETESSIEEVDGEPAGSDGEESRDGRRPRKRRRRGGRGRNDRDGEEAGQSAQGSENAGENGTSEAQADGDDAGEDTGEGEEGSARTAEGEQNGEESEQSRRRRRRGRRGGRRNRRDRDDQPNGQSDNGTDQQADAGSDHGSEGSASGDEPAPREYTPAPAREEAPAQRAAEPVSQSAPAAAEPPRRRSTIREPAPGVMTSEPVAAAAIAVAQVTPPPPEPAPTEAADKPRKTGWWGKRLLGDKS
jgi:ribonuclease E